VTSPALVDTLYPMEYTRHIIQYLSTASKSTSAKALNAALNLFARHGYNRTSMADVAEAAGISRATLYVHFKDKEALVRALADNVVNELLQHMRDAWQADATFGKNLEAAILAKDVPLHRLRHTSPHGGELLFSSSKAISACAQILEAGFIEFLCSRAKEETDVSRHFEIFGGVAAFGVFVAQAAAGLKDVIASEDLYRAAIHTFVTLVEAATSTRRDNGAC
jgi:AcrR family transcriptional regulator